MGNKTEATFHGPPSDPWPAESLPQRVPEDVLTHWDRYWLGRAEYVAGLPPWVKERRRQPIRFPSVPVDPPTPVAPRPVRPTPSWVTPVVAGAVGGLALFAGLAFVLALGLL